MSTPSRWRVIAKTGLIVIGVFVAAIVVDRVAWFRYKHECKRLYEDLVRDVEALNAQASRPEESSVQFESSYFFHQEGKAGHVSTTWDFRGRGLQVVGIFDSDHESRATSVLFRPPAAVWTRHLGVGRFELRGRRGDSADLTLTGHVSIVLDSSGVPKSVRVAQGDPWSAEYIWDRPDPPATPGPPENHAQPKTPSKQE
jgi:hypothetical protein